MTTAIAVLAVCAAPSVAAATLMFRAAMWDTNDAGHEATCPHLREAAALALLAAVTWPWVLQETVKQLRKGGRT